LLFLAQIPVEPYDGAHARQTCRQRRQRVADPCCLALRIRRVFIAPNLSQQ
jgi:hypothetical protein